ncbi:hypothetical protein C4D60_Mb07t08990 [Musa balbisiana]|uniref:Uncharacterized protein n=1 Tax=Musa balbisiana TaxID=52838 RepID=A0A4S8JGI6_MUSBA|nr:hypothetical protein C4D60_Mb07t08990 [Musa balbisiana]
MIIICRKIILQDQLVAVINSNRTSHKTHALFDNAGLGCLLSLAIHQSLEGSVRFVDTCAPNCGVEAPTLAPITGRLLACQSTYVSPEEAFDILIENARSLQILYDKNHTEVGVAVSGTDGGAPYFWCVLFSNGTTNSSFVLQGGVTKTVHPGCLAATTTTAEVAVASAVLRAERLGSHSMYQEYLAGTNASNPEHLVCL